MCDCKSCIETDNTDFFPRYRWLHWDGEAASEPLPPQEARPFAQWPRGDRPPSSVYGRVKIPKDKAYIAHWNHCGAEAHRTRAKLDMRQYIPPTPRATVDITPASPRPATIRLPHTRLNESGWRERMRALNEQSRETPCIP